MAPAHDYTEKAPAPSNPAPTAVPAPLHAPQARSRFLAFIARQVGSREAAEDILQDAYARGLAQAPAGLDEARLTAWFYRVLRNAIIDRHRRNASAHRALTALATEMIDAHEPEPHAERVCGCVGPVLATLKPEYRDAIRVVDLDDGDLGELCEQSGITPNHASVRLHRARAALGAKLRDTCGVCAESGCFDCSCGSR
jgi:RNA polymerase sigma-70 factor (ECF subfamily)